MSINRMTLILAGLNSLLVSALAWVFLSGDPQPVWVPSAAPAPRLVKAAPAPRLAELASPEREVAWQHPLFSPARQPDPGKAGPAVEQLDGVRLTGVVVDGQRSWALLRLANHSNLKLEQGDALASGWVLRQVDARSATFWRQGQAHTLNLPVPRLPAPGAVPLLTLPHVTAP